MLELNEIRNPFPGIRPFEMDETNLFFGRDGQSDELLRRLQRTRLLAVVGTSGSGKSSLIRAGLLPALYGGMMGDAGSSWRIAIQRPGGDPIGNLAAELAKQHVFGSAGDPEIQTALLETTLRRSSIGLIDAARQARMNEHENLLVVVDQFEELFRFKQSQTNDDATAFVKLLLEASGQRDVPIYIILTMRSDFLGDCSQFTGLPEAINNGQYLIPRMSRDERQSAIIGPIAVGEGAISTPLVSRLLNDVGDNPDQLPILQHALMRTWDYWSAHRRNGKPVDLEDYTAIGTMAEALSRHADEAFNELPDDRGRLIAEKLFKRLTEKGTDNREIRRPTSLNGLCAVCEASEDEVKGVIEVFRREGRSFLMPPVGTDLTKETVIDISHESLIRNWTRLQKWVDEEAQSSRTYRRLAEAAVLHREGNEGLLQDPGLQIALDWFEKNKPNAAWARRYHPDFDEATKYLAASCEAREEAQREHERQRNAELERVRREREQAEVYAQQQLRTARRLRRFSLALVIISIVAFAAAGGAVYAFAKAKSSESAAQVEQKKSHDLAVALYDYQKRLQTSIDSYQNAEAARIEQTNIAKQSAAAAEIAKDNAKAEATRAEEQKQIAEEQKATADKQRADAVALKVAAVKSKEANDKFREAALNVQRGKYYDAQDLFSKAIKGYEDADVANHEAIADAKVEIGNVALATARQNFSQEQAFAVIETDLKTAIDNYNDAAKTYADSGTMNALDKAAATNFSLAMNLLPFANATADKASSGASSSSRWNAASGEIPSLSLGIQPRLSPAAAWDPFFGSDPATKLENETVAHLKEARSQYREILDAHKDITNDPKTMPALEGMRKASYQLGDFFLKQAIEESTNRAYKTDSARQKAVDIERRQAIFYFEDLLSTFEVDDVQRGRLIIWLAGLHLGLAQGANAEDEENKAQTYLNRTIDAYVRTRQAGSPADALSMAGNILSGNGQLTDAIEVFRRAKAGYQKDKKMAAQAEMAAAIAELLTKQNQLEQALNAYVEALTDYQSAHQQKSFMPPYRLVEIARFFKSIGGEVNIARAIQALDLAVDCGDQCDFYRNDLAAAYSEKGSILWSQNKTREAIDAYKQAVVFYEAVSQKLDKSDPAREKVLAELDRVKTIIVALQSMVRTPGT
jgi:tetratricopeptide (TPR) repeat protein